MGERLVCVKVAGRANFTSSVDFKTLIVSLWQSGYSRFILDLTDCLLMDSTFLGVLAGLGLKFGSVRNGETSATIELLNPNARIADLLENLGIAHLYTVTTGPAFTTEKLSCLEQEIPVAADRREISRACLEAHQTLMDINPANVAKFKDVAQFLAENLKKAETSG